MLSLCLFTRSSALLPRLSRIRFAHRVARHRDAERTDHLVRNWIRNRNTVEFLGIWEQIHNPDFNPVEFDGFRRQAGLNSFTLTSKQWIERTGAIGIVSRAGRYGGTFAHKDIAFEFAAIVQSERLIRLNRIAIQQMRVLVEDETMARLGDTLSRPGRNTA